MQLQSWPAVTDDPGDKQTGTVWDKVLHDGIKASVEDNVHSTTNPTVRTKTIIDEVVTARGTKASLDARLDVALNEDGTPKAVAGQAALTDVANIAGSANLLGNDDFQVWPDGDTSAPVYWVLAGAGGTIARTGTGLGDTKRKVGDFAAAITRSGTDVTLTQTLLSTTAFARADHLKGKYIAAGVWAWVATGSVARISVRDGSVNTASAYHTGDSTWRFLPVTHLVDGSATKLEIVLEVNTSNNTAYFSGVVAVEAGQNITLTDWRPSPTGYGFIHFEFAGGLSNMTDARRTSLHRAGIIKDVQASLKTAGTTVNFDVLTNSNATPTYESALSATLAMTTNKFNGTQSFHATYARRCLRGGFGTSPAARSLVSVDVSNVAGAPADGALDIRVLVYQRPYERFLAYNE